LLLCVALLASCALKEKISPLKLDTQQGHVLPPEAVAKLKPGMTKAQVRFLLGTPLLNDLFNPDRLYYIYRNQKGDGPIERGNLTLYFKQDKLVRFETDLVPQQPVAVTATEPRVKGETTGKSPPISAQPVAKTEQKPIALAGTPVPPAAQRPESILPPLQLSASTKTESVAPAGARAPALVPRAESIQPPISAQPSLLPAAKPGAPSDEKLVVQTIQGWLGAWMKQDVESYLGFYAQQFKTPDNESRSKWEQTRRARVSRPRKIEIRLSALKVQIADAENATAIFRQDYRSDSYRDSVIKELTFMKQNGVWRIGQERVVKAGGLPQAR
jgi:outer membrane protein assembly factor BamE (lipoprotein component of BamABCDE complex)